MTRHVLKAATFTLALAMAAMPATAEPLDAAKAALNEAFAQVQTLTADVVMNMSMGPGMTMRSTGTIALMRDGNVVKYRQESNMTLAGAPGGIGGDSKSITLFDGEHTYIITEMMGQKTAVKSDPREGGKTPTPGGDMMWDSLSEDYTLTLKGEERIDGEMCYVIAAQPKDAELTGPSTFYFDQKLGVLRRIEMKVPDMPGMSTINYSNFALNSTLDPALFVHVQESDVLDLKSGVRVPESPESVDAHEE